MKKLFLLAALILLYGSLKQAKAQVAVTLNPYSRQQFFSSTGAPLASGCVFTYQAGTSTPLATYTDSTGLFQNSNPIILDSAGEASIWLTANAYRFVLVAAGGTNCSTGPQQWALDFVTPPPFLNGNNAWTGNETHSGTETFNGAVVLSVGGSMNGTFTGSPNFSGTPSFSGGAQFGTVSPVFNVVAIFNSGLTTDTITGINSSGGTLTVTGHAGAAAQVGEAFSGTGGAGGAGAAGGAAGISGGVGGSGAAGGAVTAIAGNGGTGNGAGGVGSLIGGDGTGSGNGGNANIAAGNSTGSSNGGDVNISNGVGAGAGLQGRTFINSSHIEIAPVGTSPTCVVAGAGATATCSGTTDSVGFVNIAATGAGPAASGNVTLTLNRARATNGICTFSLASNTGTWNARATLMQGTLSTTAIAIIWDNNSAALTTGQNYTITYACF